VCVYIYIYIYTYTHTYIYIYTHIYIHYRSTFWDHPDNFVFSMKTHFYLSNELQNV